MSDFLAAPQGYLDRVLGGVSLIALHEAGSLRGHVAAVQERLQIARRARSVSEMLRDQFDLLPESRNRLRRDHQVRRQLWRGLASDLRPVRPRA
ncbi:MAG TPA: hypothetical protein VFV11_03905 [Solimonas sp.]|nr:hypothetical protein [Solimonas sp.]